MSGKLWKEYVAKMETTGSAQSVTIFNPVKQSEFVILPRLKCYVQTAIPANVRDELKRRPKSEKLEVAQENIHGHRCTKYKLTFENKGMDVWRTWETPAAFVWNAHELRGCPLRVEVLNSAGETNESLVFNDIDPKQPDGRLFEEPKGFTKCTDLQALMIRIKQKWPKDT